LDLRRIGSKAAFVLITGSHGFERTVMFALDDDTAVIAERVRETLDE
jgi:hypothetical protein